MNQSIIIQPVAVDFAPASALLEVVQNVRTICATIVGTVPLDRSFGVDAEIIDASMPVAQARLTAALVVAVNKYEPRARVLRVAYTGDAGGRLVPKLEVEIDVS